MYNWEWSVSGRGKFSCINAERADENARRQLFESNLSSNEISAVQVCHERRNHLMKIIAAGGSERA